MAAKTLTFTDLLVFAGLEPAKVKILRHGETDKGARSPFSLWVLSHEDGDKRFEAYQTYQKKGDTRLNRPHIASFVVSPHQESIFVGIYENRGSLGTPPEGTVCPVKNHCLTENHQQYDLRRTNYLESYIGRLVIDWGKATRNWSHNAEKQEKPILYIKKTVESETFPGFEEFKWLTNELDRVPNSWKEVLKNSQGVYLLTCLDTGKRYVGSASGEEKFWGRWQSYFSTGHGGNKRMKAHKTSGYQVCVLEVAASGDSVERIIERENNWKEKLLTRHSDFGLNEN